MKLVMKLLATVAVLGIVVSSLLYSLLTGATAYETGYAAGSFIKQTWPYLLSVPVVVVFVVWVVLELTKGRNRRE